MHGSMGRGPGGPGRPHGGSGGRPHRPGLGDHRPPPPPPRHRSFSYRRRPTRPVGCLGCLLPVLGMAALFTALLILIF